MRNQKMSNLSRKSKKVTKTQNKLPKPKQNTQPTALHATENQQPKPDDDQHTSHSHST